MISKDISCSQCGHVIGQMVAIDGIGLLRVNNILVRSLHGACQCGNEFHWSVGDYLIAELIMHVRELRSGKNHATMGVIK
jgi:hypothetical protein